MPFGALVPRPRPSSPGFGSYFPSSLAYRVGQVRFELRDIRGSVEPLEEAVRQSCPGAEHAVDLQDAVTGVDAEGTELPRDHRRLGV